MARDKPMDLAKQQLKWEKKKEKMEKRDKTERGAMRKTEKDLKKHQKEELREHKDEKVRGTDPKVHFARAVFTVLYIASVVMGFKRWAEGEASALFSWIAGFSVLTFVWVLLLSAAEAWQARLEKVAAQKDAADAIKDTLERKHQEKEREALSRQRRQLLQREARERQQRRDEEEARALNAARELARSLRRQREEREAAERKAAQALATKQEGARDEHGWTQVEYQALKEAVRQYPESWSHSRKQRWDMIASEVGHHNARACEACFGRLEARRLAGESKGCKDVKDFAAKRGLADDLDWLEDSGAAAGADWFPTEEDDDEEDEDEEEEVHRERMPIELEPDHKGTEIRLEGIKTMQGCATVQLELLHVQLACADCRTAAQVYLSGADEDAVDAKLWCEGCSGLIAARLRPTLLHAASSRLCYVDCVRCRVTDVLPSVLMSICESCHAENVHKNEFVRNRGIDGTCFECHAKYAFRAESIRIDEITPCDPGGKSTGTKKSIDDPMDELAEELRYLRKKAKSDPRQQLIKLGSPLPQMGACRHFKKSYKWYRFACCGRAFPCPQCHADSGCPAAGLGAQASRMICGKCSMEQSYSPARPCEKCGFAMVAKGSAHWDDGSGTRSITAMSTKDSKKFKGGVRQANSKSKTSSSKAERVGVKAKAKRDHDKKFGRDA